MKLHFFPILEYKKKYSFSATIVVLELNNSPNIINDECDLKALADDFFSGEATKLQNLNLWEELQLIVGITSPDETE